MTEKDWKEMVSSLRKREKQLQHDLETEDYSMIKSVEYSKNNQLDAIKLLLDQVPYESKVEAEQKQSVKCLECTNHRFCKLPERKLGTHQCKKFLSNGIYVFPHESMADMIEDILNTLLSDNMLKEINTEWVSRHIVIEMSKRGVFVEL